MKPFLLAVLILSGCAVYRNSYELPGEKKIKTSVVQWYVPYPWNDNGKNLQNFGSNFGGNTVTMGQSSEAGTNSALITVPVQFLSQLLKAVPTGAF